MAECMQNSTTKGLGTYSTSDVCPTHYSWSTSEGRFPSTRSETSQSNGKVSKSSKKTPKFAFRVHLIFDGCRRYRQTPHWKCVLCTWGYRLREEYQPNDVFPLLQTSLSPGPNETLVCKGEVSESKLRFCKSKLRFWAKAKFAFEKQSLLFCWLFLTTKDTLLRSVNFKCSHRLLNRFKSSMLLFKSSKLLSKVAWKT